MHPFRDHDLAFKMLADRRTFVEVQVHDSSRMIPISLAGGVWHELRVRARGPKVEAWVGESPIVVHLEPGQEGVTEGRIGLWTRGTLSVKDVRLVRPRAAGPRS